MTNFALTGIAGYIAPRHLVAIRDTGSNLIATLDPHDSVGVLDNFFPEAYYFSDIRLFEKFISLRNTSAPSIDKIQYMSICSPNHLHYSQIMMALDLGLDVICEKPLVLSSEDLRKLVAAERTTHHRVYPIMQVRYHPSILRLQERVTQVEPKDQHYKVRLTYITRRGNWYQASWKGNPAKSGGVAMAIGIHFFDILSWIFGAVKESYLHLRDARKMAGFMELEQASVEWFLSIDGSDLPPKALENGQFALRSIEVNNVSYDFSDGFTNLHTLCYQNILTGNGPTANDALPSIQTIEELNEATISNKGDFHPLIKKTGARKWK